MRQKKKKRKHQKALISTLIELQSIQTGIPESSCRFGHGKVLSTFWNLSSAVTGSCSGSVATELIPILYPGASSPVLVQKSGKYLESETLRISGNEKPFRITEKSSGVLSVQGCRLEKLSDLCVGSSFPSLCEGDKLQNSGDPNGGANEMQNSQIAA